MGQGQMWYAVFGKVAQETEDWRVEQGMRSSDGVKSWGRLARRKAVDEVASLETQMGGWIENAAIEDVRESQGLPSRLGDEFVWLQALALGLLCMDTPC